MTALARKKTPEAITREQRVPGYRNEIWLPRPVTDDERPDIEAALREFERRLVPASKPAIISRLGRLMNTSGTEQKLSAGEVESKLQEYAHHLVEFSEDHIDAAIAEHVRTEKWFPKIVELRDRLLTRRTTADVMRRRARILLGLEQPSKWELDMMARLESERAQRELATEGGKPAPELSDRLGKLPPALAETTRRMMEGARKGTEERANS